MKIYKDLFYKICDDNNFRQAYFNAIKCKKHYREVKEIEKDRENYIINLAKEVREKRYKVSPEMNFDGLTDKNINVLGSYWGILKHGDCRNLWYKYTSAKTFYDLKRDGRL